MKARLRMHAQEILYRIHNVENVVQIKASQYFQDLLHSCLLRGKGTLVCLPQTPGSPRLADTLIDDPL